MYDELRRIARQYMSHERPDDTLQPTGLVHEAYLRLIDIPSVGWNDRAHFFAVCAQIMRRILLDRARERTTAKRGGPAADVRLDDIPEVGSWRPTELIALDDALTRMEQMDPRKAKVIELRFFAGLSVEETAAVLKISPQTVLRDWKLARAWLERELRKARNSASGSPGLAIIRKSMQPERWQEVERLFHLALECEPKLRSHILAEASSGDPELLKEVALLLEHADGDSRLDRPVWDSGPPMRARLGTYEIEAHLGIGGMGEVFRARDPRLKRTVAIKISKHSLTGRFKREARAVAALNHPNIVQIYEFGSSDGNDFIAMEFIAGRTVAELISEKPCRSIRRWLMRIRLRRLLLLHTRPVSYIAISNRQTS